MGSRIRKQDESREKILTAIVADKVFHNEAEIVEDKERQIAGIDAIIDGKNVDFKFQVGDRYIGHPTPTFCFELKTKNRAGNYMKGWFLDESKLTDEYGLVWIHEGTAAPFQPQRIEYMQIDVQALRDYVAIYINEEKINSIIEYVEKYRPGESYRQNITQELRISYSSQLFEKPFNMVIQKSCLEKFATKHVFVEV